MTFDKRQVVYQIYPKSYKDDRKWHWRFTEIISKLPYLAELELTISTPTLFYPSPQRDNGYDVSDYTAINPLFGTMADFEELAQTAESIALNSCWIWSSTTAQLNTNGSKSLGRDPFYQDFFILRDAPTDWVSKFGGNAWAPFGDTGKVLRPPL